MYRSKIYATANLWLPVDAVSGGHADMHGGYLFIQYMTSPLVRAHFLPETDPLRDSLKDALINIRLVGQEIAKIINSWDKTDLSSQRPFFQP